MEDLKTKRPPRALKSALLKKGALYACAALVGFCLSAVRVEGDLSPFAAAFAAGAPGLFSLPAALGAAGGALLFLPPLTAVKYVGAAVLAALLRAANDKFFSPGRETWLYPLISFSSVLVCAGVTGLAAGGEALPLTVPCEALIAGACTLFFYRAMQVLPAGAAALGAGAGDGAAVLLSGGLLLLSLDGFRLWGASPAHVLAFLAVLTLSFCAGQAAGAAAGIAAGLMLGFAPENVYLAYFLPAAGLLCGVVAGYGRLAAAGAFSVLGAALLVLRGEADTALVSVTEIVLAALTFALLPKKWAAAAAAALRPLSHERFAGQTRALVKLRLRAKAKAVRDVADSVQAVCRLMNAPAAPVPLADTVRRSFCEACVKKDFCWGALAETTRRSLARAEGTLRRTGALTPEDLTPALFSVCRDAPGLIAAFERAFCEETARLGARNEIADVKSMAAAQFGSLAAVLEDAAQKTGGLGEADPYLAALAQEAFNEAGFGYSALCVSTDPEGRALLEVFCTRIPRLPDYNDLLRRLHRKTNVPFSGPVQDEYKKEGAVLSFCERTALKVEYCKLSAPAAGENLCGDTAEAFADGRGAYYCVLSDGMGSGKTAAVDSVMTCTLFSRLMKAGFAPQTALEAVNCAMMVKSEDETLATLDVLRLDLYTGKAEFFKAGGAKTVLRRGGKTAVVEPSSLPLGIMREVKFERSETDLSPGDAILMLSDGADPVPRAFFKDLFYEKKNAGAKELARAVLEEAVRRSPIGRADDITAVCLRVLENA